jgi:hypothetical protein
MPVLYDVAGNNTTFFVDLTSIPKDRKITYGKLVCDFKPSKTEKNWVILTFGGDRMDYSGDTATSTADITTFKILINSTLSTTKVKMRMMDINKLLLRHSIAHIRVHETPSHNYSARHNIKYNFKRSAVNGWMYLDIHKGMYGLKQAGLLANPVLKKRLTPFGYYPARHTPSLWLQNTKSTAFSLVADDFAVKYVTKFDANHLLDALL